MNEVAAILLNQTQIEQTVTARLIQDKEKFKDIKQVIDEMYEEVQEMAEL